MPSTTSDLLRFQKMATGEKVNIWGEELNETILELLEDAIAGVVSFALSGAKTLTTANWATDEARKAAIHITGGTGGTVTIPAVQHVYVVRNDATGDVTFTCTAGDTAIVKAGQGAMILCDGTDVMAVVNTDFANQRATRVAAPVDATDAANKQYVDDQNAVTRSDIEASEAAAAASAQSAADEAAAALVTKGQTEAIRDQAAASRDAAAASASASSDSADQSASSATASAAARDTAQEWASKPEDQVVSGGLFSARHYAAKAAASAVAAAQPVNDTVEAAIQSTLNRWRMKRA